MWGNFGAGFFNAPVQPDDFRFEVALRRLSKLLGVLFGRPRRCFSLVVVRKKPAANAGGARPARPPLGGGSSLLRYGGPTIKVCKFRTIRTIKFLIQINDLYG